jgi:restriction system protein
MARIRGVEKVQHLCTPCVNGKEYEDKLKEELANYWIQRLQVQHLHHSASFFLQTVIKLGERTHEGQLITAVALPWFEILEILRRDPAAAYTIPPRKWEEIIAGVYKRSGFDEVTLTPRSGDHGRDVIAVKRGVGSIRVIDQVKAYKPSHLVNADDVRALMGVLQGDGASKGFLTTTSDFAPRLHEDPLIIPFIPSRLELINGRMLLDRLKELAGAEDGTEKA